MFCLKMENCSICRFIQLLVLEHTYNLLVSFNYWSLVLRKWKLSMLFPPVFYSPGPYVPYVVSINASHYPYNFWKTFIFCLKMENCPVIYISLCIVPFCRTRGLLLISSYCYDDPPVIIRDILSLPIYIYCSLCCVLWIIFFSEKQISPFC